MRWNFVTTHDKYDASYFVVCCRLDFNNFYTKQLEMRSVAKSQSSSLDYEATAMLT